MAPYVSTELYQFTVFINHGDNGWSESFFLRDQTRALALATAAELLEARSWILAGNCVIEWAEIKYLQGQRNIQAAIGDPVEPLAMWAPPDNDTVGLLFRFQTGTGKYANHLIRAIADDEITDQRWTRAPLSLPAGVAPRPVDPTLATKDELFRYFLTLYRERTCHPRFLGTFLFFGDVWELSPWSEVIYRHPSARAFGSAYHRVSAEWGDWTRAADFSYCGTVAGVLRSCRDVDTYAYVDGPRTVLRFYNAVDGATVFPHPHIFFGIMRDKDIENTTAPGELSGPKKTLANPAGVWEWTSGLSAGNAPGVAFTGPPSRFLGLDTIPFDPFPDTPIEYRPGCDVPIVHALRVRSSSPGVDVADTYILTFDDNTTALVQTDLHEVLVSAVIPANVMQLVPRRAKWFTNHWYYDAGGSFSVASYSRVGDTITFTDPVYLELLDISGTPGPTSRPAEGDRILISDGTYDSGIWVLTHQYDGVDNVRLDRAADFSTGILSETIVQISDGLVNAETRWLLTTADPIVINITPLFFTPIGAPNYALKVRNKAIDEYWPALGHEANDLFVTLFKGWRLHNPIVVPVVGPTPYFPGANSCFLLNPSGPFAIFELASTETQHRVTVYNGGPDDCQISVVNTTPGGMQPQLFNLRFGQAVELIYLSPGTGQNPSGDPNGWFLYDSVDHIAQADAVAAALAAAPLSALQSAQVLALI